MKKIILSVFLYTISFVGLAQPEYKNHEGFIGRGSQYSYSANVNTQIFETRNNTAIVAGIFNSDTIDVNPDPGIDNFFVPDDGRTFFIKFDTAFNYQWALQFGGTGNLEFYSGTIDASGNIYLAGSVGFGAIYDLNAGAGIYMADATVHDKLFVVKYSPSGSFIWGQQAQMDYAGDCAIDLDENGHVLLSGSTNNSGNVDLDPGAGVSTTTGQGGGDVFVIKYDANTGAYITSKTWGSGTSGSGLYQGMNMMRVKSNGNIVMVCSGSNTVFLNPDNQMSSTFTFANATYLIELDDDLNFVNGGPILETWINAFSVMCLDNADNIYLALHITQAVDIDPTANVNIPALNGADDHVIMKFGSTFEWSFIYGSSTGSNHPIKMTTNSLNELFLFGLLQGNMDLDPGTGTQNETSILVDYFFCKFSGAGELEWGYRMGGTSYETDPFIASVGTDIYLHGNAYQFDLDVSSNTVIFDEHTEAIYHFIAKYGECPSSVNQNVINSNYTLTAELSGDAYQWVDCNNANAPVSGATSQTFMPSQDGDYACIVTVGSCSYLTDCSTIFGVGIDAQETSSISIYPNPSNGEINILSLNNKTNFLIEVYDLSGKLVYTEFVLDKHVVNLAPGHYVLRAIFEEGNYSHTSFIITK